MEEKLEKNHLALGNKAKCSAFLGVAVFLARENRKHIILILGFKLSYTQLPCSGASPSYTTGDA